MKKLILFLFISTTLNLIAQNELNFNYDWELRMIENSPMSYTPVDHVKQITFTKTMNKKVETHTKVYINGDLTSYKVIDNKNKLLKEAKITYNDKAELIEAKIYKNGKLRRTITRVQDDEGKPLSIKKANGHDKVVQYETWTYNEEGCLKEFIFYRRGSEKTQLKWIHEYIGDCEKSKTMLYNGRGKLKNVWTYDCKEEGEKLEKKKNLTQVCKWEELTPDILTKVYQTFDEKGKTVKDVSRFTLTDTLILQWTRYDDKDQMLFNATYDKDTKKPLTRESFKNGKSKYSWSYKYENGMITHRSNTKKGKARGKAEYTYNEDKLLSEYKSYNKTGNIHISIKLEYLK